MSRPRGLLVVVLVVAAAVGTLSAPAIGDRPAAGPAVAGSDTPAAGAAARTPIDPGSGPVPATTTDTASSSNTDPAPGLPFQLDRAARAARVLEATHVDDPLVPLALAGYSRHDGSDPLENDRRAAIYETVLDAPGTYLSQVAVTTGIPVSTVRYHVRILDDEHLLRTAKVGGKRRLYAADVGQTAAWAALNDEATAEVLRAVARQDSPSVSAVAATVDRAASTVSHHVSRLVEEGVLDRTRDGQSVVVSLVPAVRPLVDDHDAAEESHAD